MSDEVTMGARERARARSWAPTVTVVAAPSDERGAVTAEAAVVVPLLVSLALGLVWLVSLAVTQVRVVDAAREAVRVAARGEDDASAVTSGRKVAPDGSRFQVSRSGDDVVVRVAADVRGPGGVFGFLPPVEVTAQAVAAEEPR
jgi:Flp pilus assembly protein TadG